jgi:hypothetical protein
MAAQPTPFHEGTQWVFDGNVEGCFQLTDEVTGRGRSHPSHEGVQQGALAGEPSVPAMPQTMRIELSKGGQSVIGPAMGIAGEIGERSKFAENRHADVGAQSRFELWERGDRPPLEEALELERIEEKRAHNVIILPSVST